MKRFYLFGVFVLSVFGAFAQDGSVAITPIYDEEYVAQNLCVSLINLASDAVKGFPKARGKEIETVGNVTMWTSNVGLPGAITSSLLFSGSWQYEGVLYQGASAESWRPAYDRFRKLLKSCLAEKGYDEVPIKNATEGLDRYPELVYKKPSGDAAPVSMKIEKAAVTGLYVLTLNVWQAR